MQKEKRCDDRSGDQSDEWPLAKEWRQLSEAGKGKGMDPPIELPGRIQPC